MEVVKFPIDGPFGWAQRILCDTIEDQYNAHQPVRVMVLKARQLGISTATEGCLFNWSFLHPGTNGLVIAHETPSSESLFQKTKLYWETWPFRSSYTQKYSTRHQMTWLETRSNLQVATAQNISTGRGSTLHAVHASEVAFYPDPRGLFTGLKQTVPNEHGTIIILESTANGVGNFFHELWQQAEKGESEFVPLFFPWFKHFEYARHTTLCTPLELSAYERWLLSIGASYPNIEWRRWALLNLAFGDEQRFMQEYPASPDEAFITSGRPIFPRQALKECFVEFSPTGKRFGTRGLLINDHRSRSGLRFEPDPAGNLTIYKSPDPRIISNELYFVAGDPSLSLEGDPCCIQVLNRRTYEQVAVWHGNLPPISFAEEMMKIGRYYHEAQLCPEVEGGGQGVISVLLMRGYPNIWQHRWADRPPGKLSSAYGWSTNQNRKSWAIGQLTQMIADRSLTIHDRQTFNQLRNYVVLPNGDWGPSGDTKDQDSDDAVMALAIGVMASTLEGPFVLRQDNSNTIVDIFNQEHDSDTTFYPSFEAALS